MRKNTIKDGSVGFIPDEITLPIKGNATVFILFVLIRGRLKLYEKILKKSISVLIVVVLLLLAAGQTFWTHTGGDARSKDVVVSQVYDGDTIVVGRVGAGQRSGLSALTRPRRPVLTRRCSSSAPRQQSLRAGRFWADGSGWSSNLPTGPEGSIDHYGRTLAYVITETGENFNLELVRLGYGRAF